MATRRSSSKSKAPKKEVPSEPKEAPEQPTDKNDPEANRPKWDEDDNGTCFTHTADNGRHYIAQVLDDGSYAVTVTAGGQVLYSTRAANDDALDSLVA